MTVTDNCRLVHGISVCTHDNSAIVANIKDVTTGESKLWVARNLLRPLWVTKKALRTHEDKKLCVPEYELDMYQCPEHKLVETLQRALYGYPRANSWRRKLLSNPYVYGADVSPLVIYSKILKDACNQQSPRQYKVGHLDIETSVCGGREIIAISYTNYDGKIYQAVLKSFLREDPREIEKRFATELSSFRDKLLPAAQKVFDRFQFKYIQYVAEDERALISWIFEVIHNEKPDFIGIWNMSFDIPYILDRINALRMDPLEVMCHPDVPDDLRVCEYHPDMKKVEHFTDRWDWLSCSGYTQFLDSMCLYSRLRKVVGREILYTLQYIASKNIGAGKLEFGENSSHYIMQTQRFIDYCVYNIFDSLILFIMERVNDDITNMINLADCSELHSFSRQTIMLKNAFYSYCRERKLVMGAVGEPTLREWDDRIVNIGGAVLDPERAKDTGVPILLESDRRSRLHRLVFDLDVASMYPNLLITFNVDRMTRIATALWVDGINQTFFNDLFGNAADPASNAVHIGHSYFNLPNYKEMVELFDQAQQQQPERKGIAA